MAAMEKREAEIADTVEKANEKLQEANQLVSDYETKVLEINDTKEKIISEYKNEAKQKKEELIDKYKEETLKKKYDL